LVAGRIVKLHVDDNDFVKKDQVLVELDDGIGYSRVKRSKAALMEASANLKYLEAFYTRQKVLYQSGQLAKDTFERYTKDYESAQANVISAQATLEINQQTYDNLFIRTPADGIVIAKKVNLGEMITSQFQAVALFTIAKKLESMEAEIDVDEADIGVVKVGQEALFTVDAFAQRTFRAKIAQINYDYKIVDNVITYGVILNIANPKLALRPGMTTNVSIKVADASKVLCVPNKALRVNRNSIKKIAKKEKLSYEEITQTVENKAQETLWIMSDKKTFKEVVIKLGVTDGRFTQVVEGITPNTIVVEEALNPDRENPIMAMGKLKV
jgi:HlyD family secretion protein